MISPLFLICGYRFGPPFVGYRTVALVAEIDGRHGRHNQEDEIVFMGLKTKTTTYDNLYIYMIYMVYIWFV